MVAAYRKGLHRSVKNVRWTNHILERMIERGADTTPVLQKLLRILKNHTCEIMFDSLITDFGSVRIKVDDYVVCAKCDIETVGIVVMTIHDECNRPGKTYGKA